MQWRFVEHWAGQDPLVPSCQYLGPFFLTGMFREADCVVSTHWIFHLATTPWLAILIPAFALLSLLALMVVPGILLSGERQVRYTGVAAKHFELWEDYHRTALFSALPAVLIVYIECCFGLYQRNTELVEAKWACHGVVLLGSVFFWALYKHLVYPG